MMNQLEVNVGVESKAKKGARGAEKDVRNAAAANRFLSSAKLKESFSLSFESLFLDSFTEVPVAKASSAGHGERTEAPRAPETPRGIEVAREAIGRVENREAPRPIETAERREAPEQQCGENGAGTETDAPAERAAAEESASEETAAAADEAGKAETQTVATHVKIVKYELSVKLQQSLSQDQLNELKQKMEKLFEDEDLDPAEFLQASLEIVSMLVGRAEAPQILEPDQSFQREDFGKFLKKFMRELGNVVEQAMKNETRPAEAPVEPRIEQKVDDALAKLVKKMDRQVTKSDQDFVRQLEHAERAERPREVAAERPIEVAKPVELKRVTMRMQSLEIHAEQKVELARNEVGVEAAALDALKPRAKAQPTGPLVAANGVGNVGEAGRARGGEGQQAMWQQSYNQNASQKSLDGAARTERPQAPQRPLQQPVFDQIVQSMKIAVSENRGEATIKLNPESLGKVEMKIVVEDGKVNVRIMAENSSVRSLIAENINDLRKNLSDIGLEVENVLVLLSSDLGNADAGEQEEQENPEQKSRYAGLAGAEDEEVIEEAGVVADGSTVRYVA